PPGSAGFCYSPGAFWTDHQQDTHQSHEIRLSTPTDWRIRVLAGGFYEKYLIYEGTDWFYGTSPHFYPIGPPQVYQNSAGQVVPYPVTVQNPNVRPLGDARFEEHTSGHPPCGGLLSQKPLAKRKQDRNRTRLNSSPGE